LLPSQEIRSPRYPGDVIVLVRLVRFSVFLTFFVVVMTAARVVEASAIPIGSVQTWLFDGTSVGCPNCQATVTFELLTGTSLRVLFENTSTDDAAGVNILTGVGFNTNLPLDGLRLLSRSIEGGGHWGLGNGVGGGRWQVGLVTDGGIKQGLDNQSASYNSGEIIIGWASSIGIGGLTVGEAITKFQNSELAGRSVHPTGEREAPLAMPEPATLLLLSTGLIGLHLSRSRRRTPTGFRH
jgi:hypothetical protein